jgi:hypothetical protein
VYQRLISPLFGSHCRFHPTCSEYAVRAIRRFGLFKGTWLAAKRLSRCHPWSEGGLDDVPDRFSLRGRALRPRAGRPGRDTGAAA